MNANALCVPAIHMRGNGLAWRHPQALARVRSAYACLNDIARITDEADPHDVDAADRMASP
jgi:hypothetical protein